MKPFEETYADHDFKQQMAEAQVGWMAQVPQSGQPDLDVEGLNGTLLARLLGAISRGPR